MDLEPFVVGGRHRDCHSYRLERSLFLLGLL